MPNFNLRNCDCMDLMREFPDKHFDLAIVDPPYCDNTNGLNVGTGNRNFSYDKFKRPNQYYFMELFRVSKFQIIWGWNFMSDMIPCSSGVVVWNKHQNGHFSECEIAYLSQGKARIFDRPYQLDVGNKIHPTQKPVALYKWLLHNYAKQGDKIIDTHLGSGSIAIACHQMGFDLTGSELDKDYFEAMQKRIKEETKQQDLFSIA